MTVSNITFYNYVIFNVLKFQFVNSAYNMSVLTLLVFKIIFPSTSSKHYLYIHLYFAK